MKKIIILLIVVALGWWLWGKMGENQGSPGATTTPNSSEVPTREYEDPDEIFSFQYPSAYVIGGREASSTVPTGWSAYSQRLGQVLAVARVSRDYQPGTNFSEAWFTVGWSNDPQTIRSCTTSPQGSGVTASETVIDGITYKKFQSTDAAAGNLYETTAYRALLDGDCYSLEYTIHYTNIGNYDPSQGIKEFDREKVRTELDQIARSFRFLVNSD